ncbi:unnamed protein product [Cuscuta epithymum]|uniref:Protein CHUP1, chloroplastic n=1 Tax=Cuscuta epithymum TaxID=186058 RepID=A0AAV0CSL1_9ASTE|nr:unnamed protein product [Cuscuta epithymum]
MVKVPMFVRLGFLLAASIAFYAVKQLSLKTPRHSSKSSPGNCEAQASNSEEEKEQSTCSKNCLKESREEEEVKLMNKIYNPAVRKLLNTGDDIFLEFEHLLMGEMEFPDAEKDLNEIERLRSLVKELEQRELKLEGELLEYHGLKEQESTILELQKHLQMKSVEIDRLNITINALEDEKRRLHEEVSRTVYVRKELEEAKNKIKEMQRKIQLEAKQAKGQLLLLKQQVSLLQSKEGEVLKLDVELEKSANVLKELELEVMELKRKNKELQIEKRELAMKLDAAEGRITYLSNLTESEVVSKVREEVVSLRHANEDLQKQVERLQMNRFNDVEELVYLRWVNACLRYELRNYQTPTGKVSARDLSRSMSPRSRDIAKQLLLEYETHFSRPSSPGSEDFDTTPTTNTTTTTSTDEPTSKKSSLIQKLKKFGRSKDKAHRVPELVELYPTLIKRESKNDSSPPLISSSSDASSNMIGELEHESSSNLTKDNSCIDHEVKRDVETQGDFIQSLAAEVRAASFSRIDDLVAFVKWLDEELSFLVDERAVLKHFDWPEGKSAALREASFEYQDLTKLENQVSSFVDDPSLSWEAALKKMYELLEKVEQCFYALLRTRDMAMSRYREFGIPTDWLLDSGVLGKIKILLVQLACTYMKRVALELDALSGGDKEPPREFLILQGVRFASRVHQLSGGFDGESMKAFEELRRRVHTQTGEEKQE